VGFQAGLSSKKGGFRAQDLTQKRPVKIIKSDKKSLQK
jgi:hypothetical protein